MCVNLFNVATIFINSACFCGPNLDASKILQMPQIIGPGLLNRVLRDTVQGLVDAAVHIKQTFSILRTRQGDGDVVIRGSNSLYSHSISSF